MSSSEALRVLENQGFGSSSRDSGSLAHKEEQDRPDKKTKRKLRVPETLGMEVFSM